MACESAARLFSTPNVENNPSNEIRIPFPSVSKIIEVAIKTLHITGVAVFTLLCPYISIAVNTIIFITSVSIIAKNKSEIVKQRGHPNGFDEATTRNALVAMKKAINIHKLSQLTNAVCVTALAVSWAVSPILLVASTFFLTLNWVISSAESKAFKAMKRTFDDQTEGTQELHKLERLYPEIFNNSLDQAVTRRRLLTEERELRKQKKRYHLKVKEFVASAWEHLLKSGQYTVQQGLEGDWNIFQPICRLAVIKELEERALNIDDHSIAPSLRKRIAQINLIRETYATLTKDEKRQVTEKVVTPDMATSDKITSIAQSINTIADPMMQEQDLFQGPLIRGSERYCIKKLHLLRYLKLQKLKLDNYSRKLFFKADPIQEVPPVENNEVERQHEVNQLQGYLVINGQRIPIRSIQVAR